MNQEERLKRYQAFKVNTLGTREHYTTYSSEFPKTNLGRNQLVWPWYGYWESQHCLQLWHARRYISLSGPSLRLMKLRHFSYGLHTLLCSRWQQCRGVIILKDLVPHTIVNRVIVVQCYLAPERKFLWGTPRIIWISESYLKLRDFDPNFRFWHLSPSCRPRRSIRYKGIGNLIHRWWRGWKNSKICSRTIRGNCYRTSWRNWHLNLHWRPIDWL